MLEDLEQWKLKEDQLKTLGIKATKLREAIRKRAFKMASDEGTKLPEYRFKQAPRQKDSLLT